MCVIGNFADRGSGCDRDRVIGHCDRLRDRRAAKLGLLSADLFLLMSPADTQTLNSKKGGSGYNIS